MQESLLYTTITYRRTMSGGIRLRGLHNVIQVDTSRRCNIVGFLVIRLIYIRSMSNTVMCVFHHCISCFWQQSRSVSKGENSILLPKQISK